MFYSAAAGMGSAPKSKLSRLCKFSSSNDSSNFISLAASYMNKELLKLPGPGAYARDESDLPIGESVC